MLDMEKTVVENIAATVREFPDALAQYIADTREEYSPRMALARRLALALPAVTFCRVLENVAAIRLGMKH